jgi:hypothetical protein
VLFRSNFDVISIITNLLSNINPEDITALIASLKLGGSKTVNQNGVIQDGEIINEPVQRQGQNNFRNNTTPDFSNMLKTFASYAGSQNIGRMLQMFSAGNINKK